MKKYSILLAAAAIIAAASCAKEALAPEENAAGEKEQTVTEQTLTNPVTITFTANATQTKVSLEGEGTAGSKTAVWDDGDQVKIIWYNTVESTMKSKNATVDSYGNTSTTFTATVEEADYYYAVYPASIEATLDGEGNFSVNFPNSAQAPTSFAGAAWYAAKTTKDAKEFAFHPISTVIKFTLDGSAVANPNQIYFRSMNGGLNRLHGHAAVTFAADNTLTAAPDPNATTPYDGAGNVTYNVSGEGTYYIPLPGYGTGYTYSAKNETSPGTSGTDGFILWIKKSGENYPAAYYSGTITQQPGKFYNIKNPVDTKIVTDYYVATASQGSGDGLSQENAATLSDLKTNAPAFKYSGTIAGALLLNGTTINFLSGTYSEPLAPFNTNDYASAHSYTIKGGIGGTTTFTTSASSLFDETKPTITIKDITFDGCTTEPAVAVSAGTVNLDNVTFNACTSQGLNVSGGTVNASNGAAFTNNTTYEAAYISGGTLNLDHVTFSGNSARGLYIATGTVTASDCVFSGNARTEVSPTSSSTSGGAVAVFGGASTDATFTRCDFDNNSSDGDGGAVVAATANTKATFINCTFTRNNAVNGGAVLPGNGTITFSNCTFGGSEENKNTATSFGGVFSNKSAAGLNLTIDGGEISYNSAAAAGVFYTNKACEAIFKGDLKIKNNSATGGNGGVFYIDADATITLEDCQTLNNTATGKGGMTFMTAGTMNLNKCTVSGNNMGAFRIYGLSANLFIRESTISGNTSTTHGAAIHVENPNDENKNKGASKVYIDRCLIANNTTNLASPTGYSIMTYGFESTLFINNSTIYQSDETTLSGANCALVCAQGYNIIANSTLVCKNNGTRGCYSLGRNSGGTTTTPAYADGFLINDVIVNTQSISKPGIWVHSSYYESSDYSLISNVTQSGTALYNALGHDLVGKSLTDLSMSFNGGSAYNNGYFNKPTLPAGYTAPTKSQIETILSSATKGAEFLTWLGEEWGKDQSGASRGTEDSSVWTPGSIQ